MQQDGNATWYKNRSSNNLPDLIRSTVNMTMLQSSKITSVGCLPHNKFGFFYPTALDANNVPDVNVSAVNYEPRVPTRTMNYVLNFENNGH